jgi:hypothetical protein
MKRAVQLWLVLAACSSTDPSTHVPIVNAKPGPSVEVVAVVDHALRWYTVSLDGVRETRSVVLPAVPIENLVWMGRDPVFLLRDRVATVTAHGLEFIPLPPATTWDQPKPDGAETYTQTQLHVRAGALWLSRSKWTSTSYTSRYNWVNARIRPGPVVTNVEDWDESPLSMTLVAVVKPSPPVAPSSSTRVALVPDLDRKQSSDGLGNGPRMKLTCTSHGTTIEDPPVGDEAVQPASDIPTYIPGRSDLVWLSTEPPIFEVGVDNCRICPSMVIFEGCARSKRFRNVKFGPSEVMAFFTLNSPRPKQFEVGMTFLWRGHELGKLDRVDQPEELAFVPER